MLTLLRDLVQHKWNANACLLKAIGQHQAAAEDEELRKLLHHVLIANRFWLALSMGSAFAMEKESTVPKSLEAVAAAYRETFTREWDWISNLQEPDLARRLETAYIPGASFSVAEAIMQVCMHSLGHRAQCATRLRVLGGTPPAMDFIVWLKERPATNWGLNTRQLP
jgi:uncharacterized damage-inducible protein DinB